MSHHSLEMITPMKRFFRISTLIVAILFVLTSFFITRAASTIVDVSFVDVGQGDSALIHDDNNFDVLIDGGVRSAGPTVVAYLRDQSIDDIEVMIASHADADHIGGLIDVLQAADIPVESVLYNGYPGTTQTWTDFVTEVTNQGLTLAVAQFPQEYTWGSMTAYVLNPPSGLASPEQNEASVVLLVKHGDIDFLFTGDVGSSTETDILARGTPIASEVLKVAHHGSAFSSSATFLSAVSPEYAVISVGDNSYGHPSQDTLDRLTAAGATTLRTDQEGTILFTSDGVTYSLPASTPTYTIFLPLVMKDYSPTDPPDPIVNITYIFYDGVVPSVESDEYAEITNQGSVDVNLSGWRLNAGDPGQDFYFPSYTLVIGESCRVYTNEFHPEYCGFNFERGSAIWSNSGECGYLYDGVGSLVSTYCY